MRAKDTKLLSMYWIVISMLLLFAVPALSWGATISGTVRDSTGAPITGDQINVNVITGDPCGNYQHVEGTGTDSADGTYTVVVPAGTYYLRTHYNQSNYVNEWWNGASPDPSDYDCSLANSITVASGDTFMNTDFRLEIGATISGTVRDSTGTPITGDPIHVNVYTGDPCGYYQHVEGNGTDTADGTYRIVVPSGTYYLQTYNYNQSNYVNEWWNGTSPDPSDDDCSLANSITVALGDSVTNKDFWLEEAATISGTVRDSTGTPITGDQIDVSAFTGDPCGNNQGVGGTWTDPANGTYTVVVPAGTYYLRTHYNQSNYVNEWWNGASPDPSDYDCSLANSITVASGDTFMNTDFRLEIGATISGTVRDSTGTPITGDPIHVNVYTGDPCGYYQHVEGNGTDTADGTYRIVVPSGTYYLQTYNYNQSNYVNEWWNGTSPDPSDDDCSLANSITVALGDSVTNKDFWLEEAATISGTVRDSTGTPITGDQIDVSAFTGDPCGNYQHVGGTGTDSANGTYTVVVPAGTYYLRTHYNQSNYVNEWWNDASPDPSDYDCSLANSITVASGDTFMNTDFRLEIGATISGTVRDSTGTPITGDPIHVNVYTGDPCGYYQHVEGNGTDTADGTYRIVVPSGTYYLQTYNYNQSNYVNEWWNGTSPDPSDDDCSLANSITVALGDSVTNKDFWLEEAATISGTVRDSTGTPITGDQIDIQVWTGDPCGNYQHVGGTGTDSANGTYIVVVPAGTYYLRTHYNQSNYVNEWWNGASPDPSDYDCSLANSITVASGDTFMNTDFRLEIGATISGTVRDSTGTPITGDPIHVNVYTGDPCGYYQHVEGNGTDTADGTYRIVVPSGTYYLQTYNYNQSNYLAEWWNGDSPDPSDRDCSLASPITVASGDSVSITDFKLDLGGSISGTVTDSWGAPVFDMHIYVQSENCGGDGLGGSNTDSSGNYTIRGIPAGNVYVQTCSSCSGLDYIDESYNNKTDCNQADMVPVIQNTNTPNINFQLDLDSDGDGITDYDEINVYGTNPNIADTDGDGIHDGDELGYWGSDWNQDPDGDGKNNLVDEDSDNDGYLDGEEILNGSDPTNPGSTPQNYLYDDFSGTYFDSQRWRPRELVRQVSGGHLVSKLGNSGSGYARNSTVFQNPETISTIECEITVVTANLDSGNNPISFARIGGLFYNTQAAGGATGDIWAQVQIGERGSGLEAFWQVEEALDDNGNNWSIIDSGTLIVPGTLNYGTAYTAILAYDGSNNFTFTVAGQTDIFAGPTRQREPVTKHKHLATGIDGGSDAGNGYVYALFDDVYVNDDSTAYDDFSAAPLDPTLWNSREIVREITGGYKLHLAAHSEGQQEQSELNFTGPKPYIEAKVNIKSESEVFNGATGRVRIDGYFFNDTHGPGSYNGYEGNVWSNVYINLYDDGSLRAVCYVGKSMNSDESDWSDLFRDEFSIPIQTDRVYTLGIHYTGSHFVFKCMDNVTLEAQYKIYEITATNQYPAYNGYNSLKTRVYGNGSGNGYMFAEWDDVYVIDEVDPVGDELAIDFVGTNGVWNVDTAGTWRSISGGNVETMAGWANGLAMDFVGTDGVWNLDGTAWSPISGSDVETMAGWAKGLAMDFGASGVWNVDPAGMWTPISGDAETMAAWAKGLALDFGASGVWNVDTAGMWTPISGNAETMVGWANGLALDFGASGVWNVDTAGMWTPISGNAETMVGWANGLALDFGALGVWNVDTAGTWTPISGDAEIMVGWAKGLAMDFGPGIWNVDTAWTWSPISSGACNALTAVDLY